MSLRFVIRPDAEGFTVQDIWTGQPAMVAMTPQRSLSQADAEHVAELLNAAPERASAPPG